MEWLLASAVTVMATMFVVGGGIYYFSMQVQGYVQKQLLYAKRLEIYTQIAATVGHIKEIINYASEEQTVRQWRDATQAHLHDLICNAYEWAMFLPEELQDAPQRYAERVGEVLSRLDTLSADDIGTAAETIATIKKIEAEAALHLQKLVRKVI